MYYMCQNLCAISTSFFFLVEQETTFESTDCHHLTTGFFEKCIMYSYSQLGRKIFVAIFGMNGTLNELGFLAILDFDVLVWFEGSEKEIVITALF